MHIALFVRMIYTNCFSPKKVTGRLLGSDNTGRVPNAPFKEYNGMTIQCPVKSAHNAKR